MKKTEGRLVVVGKGMEELKNKYSRTNVELIGTVENIDEYYYRFKVVVCPIF